MIVLAATLHDPRASMIDQIRRSGRVLTQRYRASVVFVSPETPAPVNAALAATGFAATVRASTGGFESLGVVRRQVIEAALDAGATVIHACDLDRALHWVERFPNELDTVLATLGDADCTVIGRTARAFATHPANQCVTEAVINAVYRRISGDDWDITAATRGLSAAAARYLLEHDTEPSVGVDGTWPLLLRAAGYRLAYRATEGLEFETADREQDAIDRAGGLDAWILSLDRDPGVWNFRVRALAAEIDAMLRVALDHRLRSPR